MPPVVLDTNIVLDLFVFQDVRAEALRCAIATNQLRWIATLPMREELLRVLAYPHITKRLQTNSTSAAVELARFDTFAHIMPIPDKAWVTCKDPDDQKFIDLAVVYATQLWSKDHAIICMRKRLLALGVTHCGWP